MAALTWGGIVLSCAFLGLTILAEMPLVGQLDPLALLSPAATTPGAGIQVSADRPARATRFPRFARPASVAPVRLADRLLPRESLPAMPSRQPVRLSPAAGHLFDAPLLTAATALRSTDGLGRAASARSFEERRMPAAGGDEPVAVAANTPAVPAAETQLAMIEPDRSPPLADSAPGIAEVPAANVRPTRRPAAPARAAEAIAAVRREPATRREAPVLAYARPDAGEAPPIDAPSVGVPLSLPGRGSGTAIYDIEAATVYLPNGEKLEAHSGLGALRDDPRFAHTRNRGVTPPHSYNLTLRESLFHGVQAIRLHPIGGERNIHNRNGLLAHTYMLGPRGDSNGCVSFKDYKRFLAAFRRGEVRRLVVVARLGNPASRFARFFASKG